ncbi:MAG: cytochrome P450 [Cyanobacteria bacterium P01_A01_bin.3]
MKRNPGAATTLRGWSALRESIAFSQDPLNMVTRWAQNYGDAVFLEVGPVVYGLLSHPDDIASVLAQNDRHCIKDISYRVLKRVFGNGLLLSEGNVWKRHRRLMQPAFSGERIAQYAETTVDATVRMLDRWAQSKTSGEPTDIYREMSRLTVQVVTRSLFGIDIENTATEIGESLDVIMRQYMHQSEMLFLWPDWLPTPGNIKTRQATHRLKTIVKEIIEQRRQAPGEDLLSKLLQARDDDGSGLSDSELHDQVMTLLLAGNDTTANALTWTLMLLAQHPEEESKLRAEIDAIVGDRLPTLSDLSRMSVLGKVLNESMRLYPPAWIVGRELTDDYQIGEHSLKRGTVLYMSEWVVHRNARYFPEPEKFCPDRWNDQYEQQLPRCAYFPFGAGPHVCIGKSFALMEAKLILVAILQRYRLSLVDEESIELLPSITLRPSSGVWVNLHPVKAVLSGAVSIS